MMMNLFLLFQAWRRRARRRPVSGSLLRVAVGRCAPDVVERETYLIPAAFAAFVVGRAFARGCDATLYFI
jgi:hypothetical protein